MSLIKCGECNNEISSKAKTCPECGAPVKAKKNGVGLVGWIFALGILYFIISTVSNSSAPSKSKATSLTAVHEKAKAHFKSDKEKTTQDAMWASQTDFRVGVINDGTNRDGYARYVCSVLTSDVGLRGNNLHVGVYDIAKLSYQKKWVRIGRHYCPDK